jgi:phosphohistidine phosphatase
MSLWYNSVTKPGGRMGGTVELYFLRHGLAGQRTAWQGDDFDRPLTEEGKAKIAREATTMLRWELVPEVILTSPLLRSFQTAEIVAAGLNIPRALVVEKRLAPGFTTLQLSKIIKAQTATRIMLVGHEPDFSDAIASITGGRVICKKGGLAIVALNDSSSLEGHLVALLPPSVMAA